MCTEETLNWMCKDMMFWYMERGSTKEILYPVTKEKQKIVQKILNEKADLMIYGKNFYTIDRDIMKTVNKTSCIYYLKKANSYKKKQSKLILPYDLKDDSSAIINKLLIYYQKNNVPYSLIILNDFPMLKDTLSDILNPFSYINVSLGKILIHRDIFTIINNNLVILITDENDEKLSKKHLKLKKIITSRNIRKDDIKIMNNQECDLDYVKHILLPT